MSADLPAEGRGPPAQILRVALLPPLGYGAALWSGTMLPFVTGVLLATLTLKAPAAPPPRAALLLVLLAALLPLGFVGFAGVLDQFPYLLVGFVGLVFLHAFRLQAEPRTATIGLLLQAFAIVVPLAMRRSEQALAAASGAFLANALLAVAGLYLAFALFPGRGRAAGVTPPPAAGGAAERTRDAALAALVMLPPFVLLVSLDAASAMRVLFAVAIVLVALERRDLRETAVESLFSALMAGAMAVAFTLLGRVWPDPAAGLLVAALIGLLVAPHAFAGRHRGAVALAIPLAWVMIGVAPGSTVGKTLEWSFYSLAGVAYAVWAHALLVRLLGLRTAAA